MALVSGLSLCVCPFSFQKSFFSTTHPRASLISFLAKLTRRRTNKRKGVVENVLEEVTSDDEPGAKLTTWDVLNESTYVSHFDQNPFTVSFPAQKAVFVRELSSENLMQERSTPSSPVIDSFPTVRRVTIRSKEKAISLEDLPPFLLDAR